MLYLSESLQESVTADGGESPASDCGEETSPAPVQQGQTAVSSDADVQKESVSGVVVEPVAAQCGSADPAAAEPSAQPAKPKKDKLAILKKLGLDPPPVAKLCPDEGAFVELDPPQLNPGE